MPEGADPGTEGEGESHLPGGDGERGNQEEAACSGPVAGMMIFHTETDAIIMKKTPTKAISKTFNKTPTKSRLKSKGKTKLYHLGEEDSPERKKLTLVVCPNCSHHFKAPPAPAEPLLEHSLGLPTQESGLWPIQGEVGP